MNTTGLILFLLTIFISVCVIIFFYIKDTQENYFNLGEAITLLSNGYNVDISSGHTVLFKGDHKRKFYGLYVYNKLKQQNLI